MIRKLSFISLTLTTLAALIVSGCGSGGGDRSGLSSGFTISGTVSGPLATVNGVKITLDDGSLAFTTQQGVYNFNGKANGVYKATPTHPGYKFTPGIDTVTINNGVASFKPFVSALDTASPRNIIGSAVLQGVTISLTGGPAIPASTTDTYGNFGFTGLADGVYTVTPSKTGFTFTPPSTLITMNGTIVSPVLSFIAAGKLNDTGINQCYTTVGTDALGVCGNGNPVSSTQDGIVGRDANAATNNNTDGLLGFSFTKVCNNGLLAGTSPNCIGDAVLGVNTYDWACTQDNVTGLMWENKISTNYALLYTNLNNNLSTDASSVVTAANNNAGLCTFKDWRLPTRSELQSIVHYGTGTTSIEFNWFQYTLSTYYWSSSPYATSPTTSAWGVSFSSGSVGNNSRGSSYPVRLVRAGQ